MNCAARAESKVPFGAESPWCRRAFDDGVIVERIPADDFDGWGRIDQRTEDGPWVHRAFGHSANALKPKEFPCKTQPAGPFASS